MFDFEWTGRSYGDDGDRERGIEAAKGYCEANGIDPQAAWAKFCDREFMDPAGDEWNGIEYAATLALSQGWCDMPENVSLVWR